MTNPVRHPSPDAAPAPLGVILAGGASRRFGSPKALASVGGRAIVGRVREAMAEAVGRVVAIANEPELFACFHLPSRPDLHPGAGPVAGMEAALRWAREEGWAGALVAACDMPFLHPGALRLLVDLDADAVAVRVEDGNPPLCAYFSVRSLPAVEHVLAGRDRSVRALLASVATTWVPEDEIARFRDPALMFFNVNTPADLLRAEQIARELDG